MKLLWLLLAVLVIILSTSPVEHVGAQLTIVLTSAQVKDKLAQNCGKMTFSLILKDFKKCFLVCEEVCHEKIFLFGPFC